MKFHLFTYNLPHQTDLSDLNALLASQRVASVEKSILPCGDGVMLTVLVETASAVKKAAKRSGERRDFKIELSPPDFKLFSFLRAKRKEWAAAENIPVYQIYTNDQLVALVQGKVDSREAFVAVYGLGDARWAKYGERTVALIREHGAPEAE